jgi:hypothetical protein
MIDPRIVCVVLTGILFCKIQVNAPAVSAATLQMKLLS